MFHLRQFLNRATALVRRHNELLGRNPLPELTGKAQLMLPPVDFSIVHEVSMGDTIIRNKRKIFVETRDANMKLLNAALASGRNCLLCPTPSATHSFIGRPFPDGSHSTAPGRPIALA